MLHADAPGAATSYEGMLRHNLDTIVDALAGADVIGEAGGAAAGGPDR